MNLSFRANSHCAATLLARRLERSTRGRRLPSAFTLVEVMFAAGIFFMAMFSILGIMSQGLKTANSLKYSGPTAGMVVAEMAVGTMLEEGSGRGRFGDVYPDYEYMTNVTLAQSNGLFKIEVAVIYKANIDSMLTTYLYRPESKKK